MKRILAVALLLLTFASAALADGGGMGAPPLQMSGGQAPAGHSPAESR
jgi:hypothetical protein